MMITWAFLTFNLSADGMKLGLMESIVEDRWQFWSANAGRNQTTFNKIEMSTDTSNHTLEDVSHSVEASAKVQRILGGFPRIIRRFWGQQRTFQELNLQDSHKVEQIR